MCPYCGDMFDPRGFKRHTNSCQYFVESIYESDFHDCRFCNLKCNPSVVYLHEQECEKKRHFGPHQNSTDYYRHLKNFDEKDRSSVSNCRHCFKPYKSCNIFKHEESCLKQFDRFIGPLPETRRCEFCYKFFPVEHNKIYIYYDGKPVERVHELHHDHIINCTRKKIVKVTTERRVIKAKINLG